MAVLPFSHKNGRREGVALRLYIFCQADPFGHIQPISTQAFDMKAYGIANFGSTSGTVAPVAIQPGRSGT
jgi:hypothetical protein